MFSECQYAVGVLKIEGRREAAVNPCCGKCQNRLNYIEQSQNNKKALKSNYLKNPVSQMKQAAMDFMI